MTMTSRGKFVVAALIIAVAGVGAYKWRDRLVESRPRSSIESPSAPAIPPAQKSSRPATAQLLVVKGYVGGEKMGFVQNPELRRILAEKFQIELRADRRGSVEMVTTEPLAGIDFLWPGSQSQTELFHR